MIIDSFTCLFDGWQDLLFSSLELLVTNKFPQVQLLDLREEKTLQGLADEETVLEVAGHYLVIIKPLKVVLKLSRFTDLELYTLQTEVAFCDQ